MEKWAFSDMISGSIKYQSLLGGKFSNTKIKNAYFSPSISIFKNLSSYVCSEMYM